MALSRFGQDDTQLGQALASGTETGFIPAVMPVDATGAPIASTTSPSTTVYRLVSSAASDNATAAASAAASLRHVIAKSNRATDLFIKLYDKATAPASTDTPKLTLTLPAGAGMALDFPAGITFTLGLGYRFTTGSADNDTGAVAAADVTGLNLVVA